MVGVFRNSGVMSTIVGLCPRQQGYVCDGGVTCATVGVTSVTVGVCRTVGVCLRQ